MLERSRTAFFASQDYQPMLREIGLDAERVFEHPDIKVWRSLPERQNCTLDADLVDGRHIRLHIKRHQPARGFPTPAEQEQLGIRALQIEQIPTVPMVGWGRLEDGRSFIITEDLAGYSAGDKLVEGGLPFDALLIPIADLAARLHSRGLHHRDLYLCHFFAKVEGEAVDLKMIDAARVKRLPGWPLRQRWIVKDLAQFFYSIAKLPVTDEQRTRWLDRYAQQRGLASSAGLRRAIDRKVLWIARHDANLRQKQPKRNISIGEKQKTEDRRQ